jgi:hypothetical protein
MQILAKEKGASWNIFEGNEAQVWMLNCGIITKSI